MDLFSTRAIHRAFTLMGRGWKGWFESCFWEQGERMAAPEGASSFGVGGTAKAMP